MGDLEDWANSNTQITITQHLEHSLHDWVAYFIVPVLLWQTQAFLLVATCLCTALSTKHSGLFGTWQ
ncbi:MAG: hypothetical protein R2816_02565 [Flavobacteriaceae bacterium]